MSTQHPTRRRARWGAVVAALALAGGLQAVVQAVTAGPANAATDLVRTTHTSAENSQSPKSVAPECPKGYKIVGGGAEVTGQAAGVVRLTWLRPVAGAGNQSDRYEVFADEPAAGVGATWSVTGYAICAPAGSVAGHVIVPNVSATSSSPSKEIAAGCTNGRRVIGGGASIANPGNGAVGLHLSRGSGPLDIFRAGATEDASGFSGNWSVTAYAICANPIGALVHGKVVTGTTGATQNCAADLYSVGGATGPTPTGHPTFLSSLYPDENRGAVLRTTAVPADGLAIQAVCA